MPQHWGETWDGNHPYSEQTENILAAAILVQNCLGPKLLDDAHKGCLAHALRQFQATRGLELGLPLNFRTWPLKAVGIKRVIRSNT